jgi:hypothetical protein
MKKTLVVVALFFFAPALACAQGWQLTPLQGPNPPSVSCNSSNINQVYWDNAASPWQQYVCSQSGWVQVGVGTGQSSSTWSSGMQVYLNNQITNAGRNYIFGGGIPEAATTGGLQGWGAYANIVMNGVGLSACTICEYN